MATPKAELIETGHASVDMHGWTLHVNSYGSMWLEDENGNPRGAGSIAVIGSPEYEACADLLWPRMKDERPDRNDGTWVERFNEEQRRG